MQRYAGIEETKFFSSNLIFVTLLNIRNPTIISAGAVANDGTAINTGAKNIEMRNRNAVVIAVRPVLPPSATPAEDSTYVVVVDVPSTAPAVVATASARSADLILGSLPFYQAYPPLSLRRLVFRAYRVYQQTGMRK